MEKIKKALYGAVIVLFVSNIAVWQAIYTENQRKFLTVAFLDIGQGDAIFIESPNGNQVLVDGGPDAKVLSEISQVMSWYDKSIDMIVITNPDKDHIAGFINVLKRYDVSRVLEPGTQNKTQTHIALQDLIQEHGVEKVLARRGQQIFLEDHDDDRQDVVLTVLFPDRDVSQESSNDGSIVMRLTYGDTEVMLTGDASAVVENQILAHLSADSNFLVESDILKVGHHGSKTSTTENFLRAVKPKFAAISSGKGNKYGHPNPEVLDLLSTLPIKILRTDQMATIIMKSDGREFHLVE